MKNKAFTLIELLAVIIILGILMLIAIPSVTTYINNSRKNTYVDTANELIRGASILVNSGEFYVYDDDTTYYIPVSAIKLESGDAKSPYGKFEEAYVVVTKDDDEYKYYFTGRDEADMGIYPPKSASELNTDSISSNVTSIDTGIGMDGKSTVVIFNEQKEIEETKPAHPASTGGNNNSGGNSGENGNNEGTPKFCKRAETLHTEECPGNTMQCYKVGYSENGSKHTNIVTYGNKGSGTPVAGDAYDCDVNGDENYDPVTERFYYVSHEYRGDTNRFDTSKAVLIYYTNVTNDVPDYNSAYAYSSNEDIDEYYPYDSCYSSYGCSWFGPASAYKYLPTTEKWTSSKLITQESRTIVSDTGGSTLSARNGGGETIISPFTYTGKAARLIAFQEVNEACPVTGGLGNSSVGELDNCLFFMEKLARFTGYGSGSSTAYWMETPYSDSVYESQCIDSARRVSGADTILVHTVGVRPVIVISMDDIEQ